MESDHKAFHDPARHDFHVPERGETRRIEEVSAGGAGIHRDAKARPLGGGEQIPGEGREAKG